MERVEMISDLDGLGCSMGSLSDDITTESAIAPSEFPELRCNSDQLVQGALRRYQRADKRLARLDGFEDVLIDLLQFQRLFNLLTFFRGRHHHLDSQIIFRVLLRLIRLTWRLST
jgi:hypothetical protein